MRVTTVRSGVAAVALVAFFLAGCSSGSSGGDETSTTAKTSSTTASSTSSTTESTTTTATTAPPPTAPPTTAATTVPKASTTTAPGSNGLKPGDACSLEEGSVDCVDPEGDGTGVYLTDGAACMATHPDPSMCADLDGDGVAGYPDSE